MEASGGNGKHSIVIVRDHSKFDGKIDLVTQTDKFLIVFMYWKTMKDHSKLTRCCYNGLPKREGSNKPGAKETTKQFTTCLLAHLFA